MSSIKTTQIDGDVSVGRNVSMGGKAEIAGNVQIGHNLKVKGWLDAPNIKDVNKGIFPTVLALREAYPNPHDGWFAGVGDSTPFTAYRGEGGEWVATGGTINVNVDLTQITEDLEQLQEDLEEGLGQLDEQKPNKVELYGRNNSEPLPLDATYYYGGLPTHSVAGTAYDSVNEIFTDYIGICINHEDDSGYEPQHHDVMVFVKTGSDYIYSETFNTSEASGYLEKHVARALGSVNATPSYSGLMSADDKGMFDDMVTEVFPLTVAVASSNAGTREIGTEITPQIVLSITRKGANVPAAGITQTISPTPASVSSDKRTITGDPVSSDTTTYQISVSQGGQTVNAPAQTFSFLNFRYYGAVSTKPANAAAVKTLCQNGTLTKQLSSSTTMGKTALAASKYFVFVVPNTSVSLIVKNANSGGTVDNAGAGTVEIARVNGTADLNYKYVIVPASSNAWNFEIVNS